MIVPSTVLHMVDYTTAINGNDGENQIVFVGVSRPDGRFAVVCNTVSSNVDSIYRLIPFENMEAFFRDKLKLWCWSGIPPTPEQGKELHRLIEILMYKLVKHYIDP